jgi:hypothetical protein
MATSVGRCVVVWRGEDRIAASRLHLWPRRLSRTPAPQTEKFKKANKYIKEETVWSYLIQVANSLDAMHSRNVLHRDIKPKNVFLTGKNHVRLGDLGCAKLMKQGMARTQIGTPYYMSPEIWANRPYDVKSDVWALGCLVYELAQLAPPFLANDMNALGAKVKTAPAPRVSKHYSEDLANVCALLLSKDPRARPDIKALLAMPAVQARMGTVPTDDEGCAWAGEDMRAHMLSTIKLPTGFGYAGVRVGGPGGLALPAPSYPAARLAGAEAPFAEQARAAAPAVPPVAPARANFAAVTSPPHLGRPAAAPAADKENGAAAAHAKAGVAPVAKRPLSAAPGVGNANIAPSALAKAVPLAYRPSVAPALAVRAIPPVAPSFAAAAIARAAVGARPVAPLPAARAAPALAAARYAAPVAAAQPGLAAAAAYKLVAAPRVAAPPRLW